MWGHPSASQKNRRTCSRVISAQTSYQLLGWHTRARHCHTRPRAHQHAQTCVGAWCIARARALVTRHQAYHRADNLNPRGFVHEITMLGFPSAFHSTRRLRSRVNDAWTSEHTFLWHTCARRARTHTRAHRRSHACVGACGIAPSQALATRHQAYHRG